MNQQRLGTINKRVDVGYDRSNETVYIHASSNCINFDYEEIECLIKVLNIINSSFGIVDSINMLNLTTIELWEPAPPPAEVHL